MNNSTNIVKLDVPLSSKPSIGYLKKIKKQIENFNCYYNNALKLQEQYIINEKNKTRMFLLKQYTRK